MKKNIGRLIINVSLCLGLSVVAFNQNPFDIKTPGKKEDKPAIKNPPTVPQSKPSETKPIESPKPATTENKNLPPTAVNPTSIQPSANTSPSSGNPFDIKPGTGTQSGTLILNPSGQSKETQNTSNQPIKNIPPEIKPSANPSNDGVSNPLNLKTGFDPNLPNSNGVNTPSIVPDPNLKDLKNQLEEIKANAVQTEESISKNTWFVIYIFLVLLAGIAINFNRSYPLALMKATYNQNQLRILFKDAFKGNHTFIFGILYFLFIINAGIFLYQSFLLFNIAKLSLLFSIFIVFITYLVRHLVLFVMGVIFPLTKEVSLFSYTIGIYNLALGIALLFLNSALLFLDPETGKMLIFSGLSIIMVLYILRQVRGLLNNVPSIISAKFHFIIYLCTVEIAPWLLLSGILLK